MEITDPIERLTFNYISSNPLNLDAKDRKLSENPIHAFMEQNQREKACENANKASAGKRAKGIGSWNSKPSMEFKKYSNTNSASGKSEDSLIKRTSLLPLPHFSSKVSQRISLNEVRILRSPLANDSLPPLQRFLFVNSRPEAISSMVG
jgi:hypothetical protein